MVLIHLCTGDSCGNCISCFKDLSQEYPQILRHFRASSDYFNSYCTNKDIFEIVGDAATPEDVMRVVNCILGLGGLKGNRIGKYFSSRPSRDIFLYLVNAINYDEINCNEIGMLIHHLVEHGFKSLNLVCKLI